MKKAIHAILITWAVLTMCSTCKSQSDKLEFVKIECQDFDTETFVAISCEAFDGTFTDTEKQAIFHNHQYLETFKSLASGFKLAEQRSFDVRGTIVYGYKKTAVKYCFDKFGYFYKDGKMYYNKKLLIYISDRIYGNHPEYLDTLRQQ
jgi:hypothetical protein